MLLLLLLLLRQVFVNVLDCRADDDTELSLLVRRKADTEERGRSKKASKRLVFRIH